MSNPETVINVMSRDETGKGPAHRLRVEGKVPGVIYGHGKKAVGLAVERTEIVPFLHHTGLVKLKFDGKGRAKTAIIKDYQMNMLKHQLMHVDFMEVRADEVISAIVEVVAHGTPAGTSMGGMLDQIAHSVEVRGAANKLPESIVVDVSKMEIGDTLTMADLPMPEGIAFTGEDEQIVFSLHVARIDEPEEAEEGGVEPIVEGEEAAADAEAKEAAEGGK